MAAEVRILGVYRPEISERTYQEQLDVMGNDAQAKEHFDGLVLVEASATGVEGELELSNLGQQPSTIDDTHYFQCAYDEALLTADGQILVDRTLGCVNGSGELRFAFYLHFFEPQRPIQFRGTDLQTPEVVSVPERLARLVPYNACD
jgi:hypothetical protein